MSTTEPNAENQNSRADELAPVSRSIIIGLGGTGHQILLDIRRRILDKYGSLQRFPVVSFIQVDTDESVMQAQAVRDDDPPEVNLEPSEKLHASIGDVQSLESNLQQYPYIANWLDRNALLGGRDIRFGAGAIRARGRLALFHNYDRFWAMLQAAHARIIDSDLKRQTTALGLTVSDNVAIYVVGSLLGGTCSGMFVDAAYIAGRLQGSPDVIGMFSIPPVTAGMPAHRANAYAALTELNHYNGGHTEFTAQYSPTESEYRNRREPFNYCYLVGMFNGKVQLPGPQEQIGLLGHSIFLDLTSESHAQKKSNRDNFANYLVQTDSIGCPQNYMSFGLSAIHFPKDKVISACAFRLAAETMGGWLAADAPLSEDNVHNFTMQQLEARRLLPGGLTAWLKRSQESESLESMVASRFSSLSEELTHGKAPAQQIAPAIRQREAELQQHLDDHHDPNLDLMRKDPGNLGLWARQVLRNLRSAIEQAPRDLLAWVETMVDDPHYRQSAARAALLEARKVFTQAASHLDGARQNFEAQRPDLEHRKEAAIQKLQSDAGSLVLKLIWGAYPDAIRQDRDEALGACTAFYRCRLEIIVCAHAVRFYHEMQVTVDRLVADLDAYMVKLESIRKEFLAKEEETISSPIFVNGEKLWEGREEVDRFFARYATAERRSHLSSSAIAELAESSKLFRLRQLGDEKLRRAIFEKAAEVFEALRDDVDVLDRFFQKYPDQARREEAVRQVYELSRPFVDVMDSFYNSRDDFRALQEKRQTVIGVHNGAEPTSPQELEFRRLLDQAERLKPGQFAKLSGRYEVLFLREFAAFPLRLLNEMKSYLQDYTNFTSQGASQHPLHVRKDVTRWEPIYTPGSVAQGEAWRTLAVGWGCGVIHDNVDRAGRTVFTTSFRDEFGMPVDWTVGHLLQVEQKPVELGETAPGTPAQPGDRPPLEVHDLILTLCQNRALQDGIQRSIQTLLVRIGSEQFANSLVAHVEEQKRRKISFFDAYYARVFHYMNETRIRPSAREGQAARVEILSACGTIVRRGESAPLRAQVLDGAGEEMQDVPVRWSAAPMEVAMVDAQGIFRALSEGEALVTASVTGAGGTVAGSVQMQVRTSLPAASSELDEPDVAAIQLVPGQPAAEAQLPAPDSADGAPAKSGQGVEERLASLKSLLDKGLITPEIHSQRQAEILKEV